MEILAPSDFNSTVDKGLFLWGLSVYAVLEVDVF